MRIIIDSTTKIVTLNGVECRVWEGRTEHGVPMLAFIARVGVARDQDASQFEAELRENKAPSAAIDDIPARMLID